MSKDFLRSETHARLVSMSRFLEETYTTYNHYMTKLIDDPDFVDKCSTWFYILDLNRSLMNSIEECHSVISKHLVGSPFVDYRLLVKEKKETPVNKWHELNSKSND